MKISRFVFLSLLLGSLLVMSLPGIALAASDNTTPAASENTPPPETIELNPTYPKLEAIAGGSFEFEVELKYLGEKDRVFDLRTTAPKGWDVSVTPQYEKDKKALAIRLQPTFTTGTKLKVIAAAPYWPLPDPGEYQITVEAASGSVKGNTTLTAVITSKYVLKTVSPTGRYNTFATSGKDNYFSIKVQNSGTAAIDSINLSSTSKPEGWAIEFKPDKIDSLNALGEKIVDVNIKPPSNTIAGDYTIGLRASGKQAGADEVSIRVTVESPPVGGGVGVGIILVVVAGLIIIFMRFSRR